VPQRDVGLKLELRLSHEVLVQLIGSTRQRVNQILQHWVSAGIVRHHYVNMVSLDLTQLQAIAVG
jgi:CRP/FNR family transcriptional regulator, cyclic AMP receptor protein